MLTRIYWWMNHRIAATKLQSNHVSFHWLLLSGARWLIVPVSRDPKMQLTFSLMIASRVETKVANDRDMDVCASIVVHYIYQVCVNSSRSKTAIWSWLHEWHIEFAPAAGSQRGEHDERWHIAYSSVVLWIMMQIHANKSSNTNLCIHSLNATCNLIQIYFRSLCIFKCVTNR